MQKRNFAEKEKEKTNKEKNEEMVNFLKKHRINDCSCRQRRINCDWLLSKKKQR